jgi:hypothetical protein
MPNDGYSRNELCALNWMSMFFLEKTERAIENGQSRDNGTKFDVYVLLEKTIGGIKNLETTVTFSTLYTGQRQKDKLYEKIGLENMFEFYSDPDQYRRLKIFKKIISNKCLLTVSCFYILKQINMHFYFQPL